MGRKGKDKKASWFSARERRAVIALIPLVAILIWILGSIGRKLPGNEATIIGDALALEDHKAVKKEAIRPETGFGSTLESAQKIVLFNFDPNTATYEEFRSLGIEPSAAAGIVKYRQRGKVFQIPEDFATCYGISDSTYKELKPYIVIGEEFALKPIKPTPARNPYQEAGANKAARASAPADVRATDPPSTAAIPLHIELNGADSLTLISVRGIGAKTASAIMDYRNRLGGFHSMEQLAELTVMNEKNYELISQQIWVDSCVIQKIDINFASPNTVAGHPYMAGKKARKILKNRQMRGGWSTIEDMIEDNTISSEEAARLAPYLHFTTQPRSD